MSSAFVAFVAALWWFARVRTSQPPHQTTKTSPLHDFAHDSLTDATDNPLCVHKRAAINQYDKAKAVAHCSCDRSHVKTKAASVLQILFECSRTGWGKDSGHQSCTSMLALLSQLVQNKSTG